MYRTSQRGREGWEDDHVPHRRRKDNPFVPQRVFFPSSTRHMVTQPLPNGKKKPEEERGPKNSKKGLVDYT